MVYFHVIVTRIFGAYNLLFYYSNFYTGSTIG